MFNPNRGKGVNKSLLPRCFKQCLEGKQNYDVSESAISESAIVA